MDYAALAEQARKSPNPDNGIDYSALADRVRSQPDARAETPVTAAPEKKLSLTDRVINRLKQAEHGARDVARGAWEVPAALASGLGGMVAGGAAQAGTAAYEGAKELLGGERTPGIAQGVGQAVQQAFTYQPKSATAQNLVNATGNVLSGFGALPAIAEGARNIERDLTDGRTYATDIGLGLASVRPDIAIRGIAAGLKGTAEITGIADIARSKQAKAAIEQSQNARVDELNAKARDAGFALPPSSTGAGIVPRLVEGLSGQAKFKQYATAKSQPIVNDLARQEFGIPTETALEPKVFNDISGDAYKRGYEPIKGYKDIKTDSEYAKEISNIGSHIEAAAKSFGNSKDAASSASQIQAIVDGNKTDSFSGSAAVSQIKLLREAADTAFAKQENGVARANRAAANAIENQLERHLESLGEDGSATLKDYRDARTTIAKSHTYQKALVGSDINPQSIARDYKKNKGKFSGNLEFIGKLAEEHPDVIKMPSGGNLTPLSVVDMMYGGLAGGGSLAAGGAAAGAGLAVAGLPVARLIGRHALLSDTVQNNIAPSYSTPISDIIAGKREITYLPDDRPSDMVIRQQKTDALTRMFEEQKRIEEDRNAFIARETTAATAAGEARLPMNDKLKEQRLAAELAAQNEIGRAAGDARGNRMLAKKGTSDKKPASTNSLSRLLGQQ